MTGRKAVSLICVALSACFSSSASAQVALPPEVEENLLARSAFGTGILSDRDGALDAEIWAGANVDDIAYLLNVAPTRPESSAIGEAMQRVLLTSAKAPADPENQLGAAKLITLARLGFIDEVRTIASLSDARKTDARIGQALAIADLTENKINDACARANVIESGNDQPFWVKLRVACYVAAEETDAADLTYEVLRESGALSLGEQTLFEALVAKSELKTPPTVESAIELAIVRLLDMPISPESLAVSDAGVLASIVQDDSLDSANRVQASVKLTAMGLLDSTDLAAFFKSFDFEPAELAGPINTNEPLDLARQYQSIAQMSAPEFLRDKSARIAEALDRAPTYDVSLALAHLYRSDIASLEGALVSPEEAAAFALASMAVGDVFAARKWLTSMGGGGLSSLEESTAMRLIELNSLLALLDYDAARLFADQANIEISELGDTSEAATIDLNDEIFARIMMSALDSAAGKVQGQAALTAIAASRNGGLSSPLMRAVIDRSFRISGLADIADRVKFETAWRSLFSARIVSQEDSGQSETFGPRLKPSSDD